MLGECFTPLCSLISPQTVLELCLSVLELIRINLTLPPKCLGLKACTAMPGRHYTHGLPASAFPAGRTTGLYHQTWFLKSLYFSLLLFGWGCSWVVEHLPSICEVLGLLLSTETAGQTDRSLQAIFPSEQQLPK